MARPLRIEFGNALYHVTARGDRREPIYEDDEDRNMFLRTLGEVIRQFNWLCHAYCLMTNHYHLIIETPDGNLAKGMRQLNGVYTQASNRRHRRQGHLFQGRYKSILVDKEAYLLELTRYVVLNPVRAGMVASPADWPWSSYRAAIGLAEQPDWLDVDGLLCQFGKRRGPARTRYTQFVIDGLGKESIWSSLRQQIYLGDEQFVSRMQAQARTAGDVLSIPRAQRRAPPPPLSKIAAEHPHRNDAIIAAYRTGGYSYRQIAEHFGVHLATVGRIVRGADGVMPQCET
ncbi:MAG: transposase [Sulfuricella sp.]|nr:transposase [Sulfuricella sp.]